VSRQASPENGSTPSERPPTSQSSDAGEDPAKNIEGVVVTEYEGGLHAQPGQRVAYTKAPPDGGRHDPIWADCGGTVYAVPVRNENMVHALEHGAVWIAYDTVRIVGADLQKLVSLVDGVPFMMLSPYPGLDQPLSLQSWGHQLKLTDVNDKRIDQFITALRANEITTPEPAARCDSVGTGFDPTNPPPFDPTPPGPDAAPVG
jgi:hypothetical protein